MIKKEATDYDKLKLAATESNRVMRETLTLLCTISTTNQITDEDTSKKILKARDNLKKSILRLDIWGAHP